MHNITSENKKLWSLIKGFLYLLSIGLMVLLGYLKEDGNKAFMPSLEEQIIFEKEQKQPNDSIYYAFSPLFDEFSLSQN